MYYITTAAIHMKIRNEKEDREVFVSLRDNGTVVTSAVGRGGGRTYASAAESESTEETSVPGALPIYVYYGSNSGSSENFAQRIGLDAPAHGKLVSIIVCGHANGPV